MGTEIRVQDEKSRCPVYILPDRDACRILVISDTHGANSLLNTALNQVYPVDLVVHCGDVMGDAQAAVRQDLFPVRVAAVCGNCDDASVLPRELMVCACGHKVWAVHGHLFDVSWEPQKETLLDAAVERGADVALFGHTHIPMVDPRPKEGVLLVNPGSAFRPKQDSREPTFALLTLRKGEMPRADLKSVYG